MRPPLVITECLRVLRLVRRRDPQQEVDWRKTAENLVARCLVGLVAGGVVSVLLVPVLVWPDPTVRRSLLDELGLSNKTGLVFLLVMMGSVFVTALLTRVIWRNADWLEAIVTASDDADLDDRVKTGCMGVLIPLATAAFGIYRITHPRVLDRLGRPRTADDVIGVGIVALGMALFVHGLGFVPYEKVPFLKYLIAAAGVVVFWYGLTWPH